MNNVPNLRFKEFSRDWEKKRFDNYIKLYRGSSPRPIQSFLIKENGVNWIKIGDTKEINNYIIEKVSEQITHEGALKSRRVERGELILANSMSFGKTYMLDIDGCIYDGWFVLREYEHYFNKEFLLLQLNSDFLQKQYKILSTGGVVQNISSDIVYSTKLYCPSLEEQEKIASFFSLIDKKIELQTEKVEELKNYKKGIMQKMFPRNGETVPELRFAGFTNAWEQRKLSEGFTKYTDRVFIEDHLTYKQVSVKNVGEITLRGEQIGSNIGRKRQAKINLKKYPTTLIFTRQTVEQGGIGFAPQSTDGAIVTENMPTISIDTKVFDKNYLKVLFKTTMFRRTVILTNIEGGTAQVAIHEDDVIQSQLHFPAIQEQQKIGSYFSNLDNLITLHQCKLDALNEYKKGLLQQMFI